MSDLRAALELHRKIQFLTHCDECGYPWPCDAARALERIDALEAALNGPIREYLKWGLLDKRAETDYFAAWEALDVALAPTVAITSTESR